MPTPARFARCSWLVLLLVVPAHAAARTFAIDSKASSLQVHVGKTGIASFAGHEHNVVARSIKGEVSADFDDLSRCSVEMMVDAASLAVVAEGEPAGDAPKVEQAMKGPDVLDVAQYPAIRFRSRQVSGKQLSAGKYELAVTGDLSVHGGTQRITVPIQIEVQGDVLSATGKLVVRQTDFGIEPTSAGGGLVKVENEVTVTFRIAARGL
jgi:polyisoprenoid-binding protein YceI